ncbi:MAG: biotin transporter BioY [Betaproteobacteria bacterium AqS2]|uniref:Biotin transporter n=1 Tax=Candidatus Amphirhobacter heronislandensis TaxID=1732024 RepID=A0A930UF15_9GAMM|nr:biotin transporter BioY [Betaproteobacteria bacterium AqS2]
MTAQAHPLNLSEALWRPAAGPAAAALRAAVLLAAGCCLLTVSAKVQIPFYPVPVTLQTFVLLVLGMAYGLRLATATATAYLAAGAAGAPVFAGGAGWAYVSGPTGGYLAGFVLAMALMGALGDRGWGRSLLGMLAPMLLGTLVIFACGVGWLASLIGWEKAVAGGLYPFIPGEAAKIVLATLLVPTVWKLTQPDDGAARGG